MRGEVRGTGGGRAVRWRRREQRAGAHLEREAHVCDAGGVEAQRLVERRRTLPSRKEGIRCGAWCGPGGVRAVQLRRREQRPGGGLAGGVRAQGKRQSAPKTCRTWL